MSPDSIEQTDVEPVIAPGVAGAPINTVTSSLETLSQLEIVWDAK